jgi:hypothetical protein
MADNDNVTRARYVGGGPVYPGESYVSAMGENAAYHLAAPMLARRALRPGHSFQHEPLDGAEKASQHVVQNTATLAHAATASAIRAALRPQ